MRARKIITVAIAAFVLLGVLVVNATAAVPVDPTARHVSPLRPADRLTYTITRAALADTQRFWDRAHAPNYYGCAGRLGLYVADLPLGIDARQYGGACAVTLDREALYDEMIWVLGYRYEAGGDRLESLESLRNIWVLVARELGHSRYGPLVNPGAADPYHAPGHHNLMSTDAGPERRRTIPGAAYDFARRVLPRPRIHPRSTKQVG